MNLKAFLSKHQTTLIHLGIILLVCLYLLKPFAHPWFPLVSDGEYYLSRLANYYLALTQGQLPPRLAPTFKFGFGYPVFNYNYPLPNIIGSIFIFTGLTVQAAMKLLLSLSLIFGSIGTYFFSRKFFSSRSALVSGLVFATSPYLIFDIFHRGTYGEVLAFALTPFVLIFFVNYLQSPSIKSRFSLVIGLSLLLLSHNLYALFSLALIFFFLIFNHSLKALRSLVYPVVTSLLIVSFFWIPALLEMKYTIISQSSINNSVTTGLIPLSALTQIPPNFGEIRTIERFRQLGYAQIFILLSALYFLFLSPKKFKFTLPLLLGSFFAILFTIPLSKHLWNLFSPLKFIQHPLRLIFFPTISAAFLSAYITNRAKSIKPILIIFTLIFLNYLFFYSMPLEYRPYEDHFLFNYPLTSAAADEFDPLWYNANTTDTYLDQNPQSPLVYNQQTTKVDTNHWDGSSRTYQLELTGPDTIVEKTLYFPGWQTTINGQTIDINGNKSQHSGLIGYSLEPGTYSVTTKFTQNTPARKLGNSLSLIGLLLLAIQTIAPQIISHKK